MAEVHQSHPSQPNGGEREALLRIGQDPDGAVWIYIDGGYSKSGELVTGAAIPVSQDDAPTVLLHAERSRATLAAPRAAEPLQRIREALAKRTEGFNLHEGDDASLVKAVAELIGEDGVILDHLKAAKLRAAEQAQEAAGEIVVGEGDTAGWSVIKWRDKAPPLGTKLYAAPLSSKLAERAVDLHDKASMPWDDAYELALREAGFDADDLRELIGECDSGTRILATDDDFERFTRAVLVWGAARFTAPLPAQTVPEGVVREPSVEVVELGRLAYREIMDGVEPDERDAIACAFKAMSTALAATQQPAVPEPNGPEFTDWGRAAIAWVLWHHQGGSSPVGQPLRFALGLGQHDPLPDALIADAKRWAQLAKPC